MQLPQFLELVGGEQDGSFVSFLQTESTNIKLQQPTPLPPLSHSFQAVRESAESGSLELGLRTGGKTRRVNICASSRGCHLEGSNRYFEHVLALMEFYEVHETSDLPCRVRDPIIPRTFRRRTSMHDSRRQSSRMRVSPPKKEKPLQSEASFKAPHHAPLLKQPSDTLQVPVCCQEERGVGGGRARLAEGGELVASFIIPPSRLLVVASRPRAPSNSLARRRDRPCARRRLAYVLCCALERCDHTSPQPPFAELAAWKPLLSARQSQRHQQPWRAGCTFVVHSTSVDVASPINS